MRYIPSRGGHAPGHLREPFLDWIDDYTCTKDGDEIPTVIDQLSPTEERKPIRWLIGQLWNCTDIMPWMACQDMEMPHGSTYAKAVRKLALDLPGGDR